MSSKPGGCGKRTVVLPPSAVMPAVTSMGKAVSSADPWRILHGFVGVMAADTSGEIRVNVDYYGSGNRTVYNSLGYQVADPSPEPPTISVAPGSITVPVGTDGTFSVSASSLHPFAYQ